jgi:hypothetical protein
MIKALSLIFESEAAWNRVALAQRSLRYIVLFYLLPMMLTVAVVEGIGLVKWGRWQSQLGDFKRFTPMEAFLTEAGQLVLMALVILIGAHLVKAIAETFRTGDSYTKALTVVIYGLSPVFLFRLLDAIPTVNLWIPWGVGIALTVKILYHGVPRIMLPDPPQAMGLYLMSSLLLVMVGGMERLVSIGFLGGKFKPMSDFISHIAAMLHF